MLDEIGQHHSSHLDVGAVVELPETLFDPLSQSHFASGVTQLKERGESLPGDFI